ncbi:MAG: DUF418 domain-containing protein [Chloroflexaceae bacterium]|nr:DUF418 domain-containing protein [Chloroflexaceae bacterium]
MYGYAVAGTATGLARSSGTAGISGADGTHQLHPAIGDLYHAVLWLRLRAVWHPATGGPAAAGSCHLPRQIAFSTAWLRAFRMGPLEWLWRVLTYGKTTPLRRTAAA